MSSSSIKDSQREDFSFEGPGLYVHVPFCAHHCRYCNFVVTTANGEAAHRRFLEAIARESALFAPQFQKSRFETLYIGGGTPSRLDGLQFSELLNGLRRQFVWKHGAEIALEANPDDIEPNRLAAWSKAGVTRVSLGAQSFRDKTLKYSNRSHDSTQIVQAVERLRGAGFKTINLDLMLAMPGETIRDVRYSIEQLLALSPEHVSLYELVIEPKTVFGKWYAAGSRGREATIHELPLQPLPNEDQQVEMLTTGRAMLKGAGYRHYELLNFAKPGQESRHNLLYWANRDYLGLGPGAYSYLNGRRFRLAQSVEEYYRKVEADDWTPIEEETLPADRRAVESFLLALRLEEGALRIRFEEVIRNKSGEIAALVEKGLVESDPAGVRLTERGKLFAETVFSELV